MNVFVTAPGEPTSYNLLKKLGEPLPPPKDNVLWLPPSLLLRADELVE